MFLVSSPVHPWSEYVKSRTREPFHTKPGQHESASLLAANLTDLCVMCLPKLMKDGPWAIRQGTSWSPHLPGLQGDEVMLLSKTD